MKFYYTNTMSFFLFFFFIYKTNTMKFDQCSNGINMKNLHDSLTIEVYFVIYIIH